MSKRCEQTVPRRRKTKRTRKGSDPVEGSPGTCAWHRQERSARPVGWSSCGRCATRGQLDGSMWTEEPSAVGPVCAVQGARLSPESLPESRAGPRRGCRRVCCEEGGASPAGAERWCLGAEERRGAAGVRPCGGSVRTSTSGQTVQRGLRAGAALRGVR